MRWRRQRVLSQQRGRKRWPKRVFLTVAAVSFIVLAGWAAKDLLDAATALRTAESRIDEADRALREARVGDAEVALDQAEQLLDEANRDLRLSPGLVLLRRVPIANQNLEALDRTIELTATLVHGGRQILATSGTLQDDRGELAIELKEGAVPSSAVREATTEIRALLVALSERPEPSSAVFVLPQIKDLQRRVHDEVTVQEDHLVRLRSGLAILDRLVGVDQPRRTLLAVANTAEMRGSGGMMLNYGVLQAEEGAVSIDEFGRVGELVVDAPPEPDSLGIPEDFQQRWSNFDFTTDWRNATLSGDFTQDAPTLLAMFRNATQLRADNVVQVDAQGLASLLSVTGPVEVDQLGSVTAENVVDLVLNEAYVLFPDRDTRTDILGDVAEEAFRALVAGDYPSIADLAEALNEAVAGRHLMMYSDDASVQSAIESFDATGSLPDPELLDYFHLTAQNMSGNKLDYYVDTSISVTGTRVPGEIGELTVSITVTNNAPVGESDPQYIFGPIDDTQTAGVYRGAVSLYAPTGTSLEAASGDEFRQPPVQASEGGRPVIGYWVDVAPGQSHVTELKLQLAPTPGDSDYAMTLVPSPRIRPTTATVDVEADGGARVVGDLVLDVGWQLTTDGPSRLTGSR